MAMVYKYHWYVLVLGVLLLFRYSYLIKDPYEKVSFAGLVAIVLAGFSVLLQLHQQNNLFALYQNQYFWQITMSSIFALYLAYEHYENINLMSRGVRAFCFTSTFLVFVFLSAWFVLHWV